MAADDPDAKHDRFVRSEMTTRALSRDEILGSVNTNVAIAMAALERMAPWGTYAFRLGVLTLFKECIESMTLEDASPELIVKARELLDLLAKMPWG